MSNGTRSKPQRLGRERADGSPAQALQTILWIGKTFKGPLTAALRQHANGVTSTDDSDLDIKLWTRCGFLEGCGGTVSGRVGRHNSSPVQG